MVLFSVYCHQILEANTVAPVESPVKTGHLDYFTCGSMILITEKTLTSLEILHLMESENGLQMSFCRFYCL